MRKLTACHDRRIAFSLMNILALDTCFGACSVAAGCWTGEGTSRAIHEFERRQTGHAEALMPMVERVMAQANLAFSDLDRIAVTTGPGSFTGMRIGVAAARALSLGTGAPVVGIPTLEVMAEASKLHYRECQMDQPMPETLLVAVDARKDQVYAQCFASGVASCRPAAVLSPQDAAKLIPTGPVILVGSGAASVAEYLVGRGSGILKLFADLQPRADCLAALAAIAKPDHLPVRPHYLRPPDAKPQDEKSISRLS